MSSRAARVSVKRYRDRGRYDRTNLDAILDAGVLCHIGFMFQGYPVVIPTLYWRDGDRVYWHGSKASRMLRAVAGAEVCLTVTHLDGLVLTRSAFHSDHTSAATACEPPVTLMFSGPWQL